MSWLMNDSVFYSLVGLMAFAPKQPLQTSNAVMFLRRLPKLTIIVSYNNALGDMESKSLWRILSAECITIMNRLLSEH